MDDLLEIAAALLPGVRLDRAVHAADGNIHHVLLIPRVAAVRVSKRPSAAAAMPRRVDVLRRLASAGLPFLVPEPLTPVTMFGDRAAVAVSWIDGAALPEGVGSVAQIAEVLAAVRAVPLDGDLLAALDGRPEGRHWSEIVTADIVPRLPVRWQPEVLRRVDAALALEPVPDALVHGDLGGTNVHWSADGELLGILDWDLAMPGDPALDVASMAWHGWDTVRLAVPAEVFHRARTWDALLGVGHLVACMNGRPMTSPDGFVRAVVPWLESEANLRDADPRPRRRARTPTGSSTPPWAARTGPSPTCASRAAAQDQRGNWTIDPSGRSASSSSTSRCTKGPSRDRVRDTSPSGASGSSQAMTIAGRKSASSSSASA